MELSLESGRVIPDATDNDILAYVENEEFAILAVDSETYLQCAKQTDRPGEYVLEYQDGSVDRHFEAQDQPIALERVLVAFYKYLHGDVSWKSDFRWEHMDL